MKAFLLVGAGGLIGSYLRYLIASHVEQYILSQHLTSSFPFGTYIVNIVGCFLIGLLFGWTGQHNFPTEYRLLLVTGFCGGFTTFSTFSYEGMMLLQNGQIWTSFLYTGGSVITGFLAVWLGLYLIRLL